MCAKTSRVGVQGFGLMRFYAPTCEVARKSSFFVFFVEQNLDQAIVYDAGVGFRRGHLRQI